MYICKYLSIYHALRFYQTCLLGKRYNMWMHATKRANFETANDQSKQNVQSMMLLPIHSAQNHDNSYNKDAIFQKGTTDPRVSTFIHFHSRKFGNRHANIHKFIIQGYVIEIMIMVMMMKVMVITMILMLIMSMMMMLMVMVIKKRDEDNIQMRQV